MDGDAPGMGCMKGLYHKVSSLSCIRPSAAFLLARHQYACVLGGCGGVLSGTVWQQMLLFGQKSERGLGWVGGLSRVRAQNHFSLLFLSLWPSFSVSPSPQLCLPWQLGKRKCEGNRVMEYVSGARGFGLFCGRLH